MPDQLDSHARQIFTFEDVADSFIHLAQAHGEDSDPDHEVGDLQVLFRTAWAIMSPEQRSQFLRDSQVSAVFEGCSMIPLMTGVEDLQDLEDTEFQDAHEFFGLDTSFQYTEEQIVDTVNAYRLHPEMNQATSERPRQA